MKYFIDTEFHEYHKQQRCLGIKIGKAVPTIDLISIGIVSEDGREYYAISKDFNIKDAWYSYHKEINKKFPQGQEYYKIYWLRENVLKPIFKELVEEENVYIKTAFYHNVYIEGKKLDFTLKNFKYLINKYGKTNKQIAEEIINFVKYNNTKSNVLNSSDYIYKNINFYGYYADYDWVVFAQLFGKMSDLPRGFPMYCKDLKQMMDEYGLSNEWKKKNVPDDINEHNALADARWNLKLYNQIDLQSRRIKKNE